MADSKIISNTGITINTGINGVTAVKSDKSAMIRISRTSQTYTAGWNTLGILPTSLFPYLPANFTCIDNSIATYEDAKVLKCEIGQDGKVYVYIPSDRTTVVLLGTVTYVTVQ